MECCLPVTGGCIVCRDVGSDVVAGASAVFGDREANVRIAQFFVGLKGAQRNQLALPARGELLAVGEARVVHHR